MANFATGRDQPASPASALEAPSFRIDFSNPLSKLLKELPDQICIMDSLSLYSMAGINTIQFLNMESRNVLFPLRGELDVNRVLAAAVPSTNDREGEKELLSGTHIDVVPSEVFMAFIRYSLESKVKKQLFPNAASIEFQFNKVAIYEVGHSIQFTTNVLDANYKGALFIALPSVHSGGDLVMSPPTGAQITWYTTITNPTSPKILPWCAFYNDIPYEITTVTEGVNMFLQFDILCTEDTTIATLTEREAESHIENELEMYSIHNNHGTRFVENDYTLHYPIHALDRPVRQNILAMILQKVHRLITVTMPLALPLYHLSLEDEIRPEHLNNVDRSLFDALLDAGYLLQLVSTVITARDDGEQEDGCNFPLEDFGNVTWQAAGFCIRPAQIVQTAFFKNPANNNEVEMMLLPVAANSHSASRVGGRDDRILYVSTLFENKRLVKDRGRTKYSEYALSMEVNFVSCAMIVRLPEMRAVMEVV